MPYKSNLIDIATLIAAALAGISGGLGGCAIAGKRLLNGKPARFAWFLAYAMIGLFFGLLVFGYGALFGLDNTDTPRLIAHSAVAGAAGAFVLAGTNISARIALKYLGIEVEVHAIDSKKKNGNDDAGHNI